jgi:tRNA nucleotidyltransferase (CCA-adding enzyme)
MGCGDEDCQKIIREYVLKWRQVFPTITGHDLKERGLTPGPQYRQILGQVRNAWLDGQVISKEQEDVLIERLLDQIISEK